ncbi:diadenylate cyclase CdaA [Candidatus Palauibacter polyketidifaciens]|uniref:diadenylate cyclase CdaA n=1 Tax=Candidatus Palauibacter polyketidifaciens TaxID=3056740 RepID=UPI00139DA60B|nr:diadenylate cyclase CdaA [Candidatus Palauibacter polyketidifaciens]MDE2721402.1 diadenylate cyclase CdaA [Candidatus Palauibacter polyketidifaciens]MYE33914.1 TIGR00159 family protein [Gemmatimonadales bacterium]
MDAFWNYLRLLQIDLLDVFEITVVAVLIYRVLILWSGTRAFQMLFGLVLLAAVYAAAGWLSLDLIRSILSQAFTYGAFALIVVFHPELRNALARIGRSRVLSVLTRLQERSEAVADEIAKAAAELSRTRTGAIIAIERELSLEEYIEKTGTRLRADVSSSLLVSLFTPRSPLHDGAVVVRDGQIVAAGVHLPLTQYPLSDRTLGTRHRATLGLSEETDAYVVVVSEETSQISLARRGVLRRNLAPQQLRDHLAADVPAPELGRPGADLDAEPGDRPDGPKRFDEAPSVP